MTCKKLINEFSRYDEMISKSGREATEIDATSLIIETMWQFHLEQLGTWRQYSPITQLLFQMNC